MADVEGRLSPSFENFEDEALDPRIQEELEKLNKASEEINRLELELDDARAAFRQVLTDATHGLDILAKKLGSCVEKARPYYDARLKAKEVHVETQKAAYMFERACSMHEAAKEMVQLAEQGYMQREDNSDPAWQEMLNHATMKVNDAETERHENEKVHLQAMNGFKEAEDLVQKYQKDLKRSINKSKCSIRRSFLRLSDIVNQYEIELLPYFEMKSKVNQMMEDRKKTVTDLERSVGKTKKSYSDALRNLEEISEAIHQKRLEMRNQAELGERGTGVGSESPSPPPMRGKVHVSIDGKSVHVASSCNMGNSGTTVTSAQFSISSSSQEFRPPSVIYSSPEKARNASYRKAIEARTAGSELEDISEDMSVNLDDEFMALPHGRSDGDSVFQDNGEKSLDKPDSAMTEYSQGRYDERTSLSTKNKKPSKLKGLILTPVGAGLDPLQANLRTSMRPHVSNAKTVQSRPNSYPYSHNCQQIPESETAAVLPLSESSSVKEERKVPTDIPTPGSTTSSRRLLKVPSVQDFDEGTISDSESITSGAMLDDDQVEFLTMDFSKQSLDDADSDSFDYNNGNLPPNLSHLQNYYRKMSDAKQQDFEEVNLHDN
ncbi:SH3 domain-binding protein 5-like isoform X1 [Mya arenaria]|uniref:SH3 domain-binding protein 5-like isoform X1 n=1 Tax=Mya arenaria TaxID=6604 RepID=UPI0022E8BAFF|nr:SH3 domain-binding protein 5-like isoform X1 [Mya arenaria]